MSASAKIDVDGKAGDYPVLSGTVGPDVVDIRKLYAQTGAFTFDPGFTSTAACESKITYIDGDIGTLLYRGYPIDQLAEKSSFLEVAYLLLNGELHATNSLVAKWHFRAGRRGCWKVFRFSATRERIAGRVGGRVR